MGVDVNLYAEAQPTPEQLEAARDFFRARCLIADDYASETDDGVGWQCLEMDYDYYPHEASQPARVVANVNTRYWSPGYERGNWPAIYGAIRLMQALFPDARICYGGDYDDTAPEVTPERLDEYWAHFLSENGDDYFARRRA